MNDFTRERFKAIRKALGMNQQALAAEFDVSQPTISGIEKGHVPIDRWKAYAMLAIEAGLTLPAPS